MYGGGINNSGSGILTVGNTTFSGNLSENNGGGINNSGTATVVNSTFTGDAHPDGYIGAAGGIDGRSGGSVTVINSIFSDIDTLENCLGITDGGGNLSDDGKCGFPPERTYVDARIGPLASNGGLTQTHALLAGSPALGTAVASACAAEPVGGVDQRGVTRPQGDPVCDSGAYESSLLKPGAQTYTVNSLLDPGDGICNSSECTLREAITAANTNAGSVDTIIFTVTGTITLGADLPALTDSVNITGPGMASLAIDGAGTHHLIVINPSVTAVISALTIRTGTVTPAAAASQCGCAHLSDAAVNNNSAANGGGGLYNTGTATITNVTFSGNTAGYGGGIAHHGSNDHHHGQPVPGQQRRDDAGGGIFSAEP